MKFFFDLLKDFKFLSYIVLIFLEKNILLFDFGRESCKFFVIIFELKI